MKILASGWLRRMAQKAGTTPQARMLALFDILQDWVEAPGMRQSLLEAAPVNAEQSGLRTFLVQLAVKAGAADAEALASQLYSILLGALREELRDPDRQALSHARLAAERLIASQMRGRAPMRGVMVISATALAMMLLLSVFAFNIKRQAFSFAPLPVALAKTPDTLNPDQVAAVYHMHDKIREGECGYPQALMLPPEQRAVYMENVVSGNGSDLLPATLVLVNQLYQRVDCYYPPAAMLL
ncbi:MAG TPA: hypothetical protein VGK14_05310 [Novimethylophilus sp.]|jgi:hypothetical protein|uniref:hypothetical protein n=1 Tax=Novimethylophilus sp. TaxID=2137426 RepID=UPI002F3EF7E0